MKLEVLPWVEATSFRAGVVGYTMLVTGVCAQKEGRSTEAERGKEQNGQERNKQGRPGLMWVVVKIMVPFWVLIVIWHLVFRGPKRRP